MVLCFIVGIVLGQPEKSYDSDFVLSIVLYWWIGGIVTGMLIIGFSEIINLLQRLVDGSDSKISAVTPKKHFSLENIKTNKFKAGISLFEDGYGNKFTNSILYISPEKIFMEDENEKVIFDYQISEIINFKELLTESDKVKILLISININKVEIELKMHLENSNNIKTIIEILGAYKE